MTNEEPGGASRRDASVKDANIEIKQERGAKDPQKEWQTPDATKGWKTVVDTMAEYDAKMVSGWKDELGNLLIFVRPTSRFHRHIHQSSEVSANLGSNRLVSSLQL